MLKKIEKFWDKNPCNVKHSNKKFLSRAYFLEISKKKFFVEPHIKKFIGTKIKNKKILEIGCGIGTLAHYFIKNHGEYYGIDISDKSLNIARHRLKIFKLNGELVKGNCELLTQYFNKKQNFDLIYSWGVLHHTQNIKKAIKEIYKISNRNTLVKIMLYSKYSYKQFMINNKLDQYERAAGVPIANSYSYSEIRKLFKNFKILNISKDHIFPYKIKDYKRNIYTKEKWFQCMPKKIFRSLEKNLGWHTMITLKIRN